MGADDDEGGSVVTAVPDLVRRQGALEKTMAKYKGKAFAWGRVDCSTLLRSHLVAMGHKRLPKPPDYSSAVGARKALKGMGFDDVGELLDSLVPRIPPAMALPGDIILMGGLDGLETVTVSVGGGKVAGWHEDGAGLVVIDPVKIKGAWRA